MWYTVIFIYITCICVHAWYEKDAHTTGRVYPRLYKTSRIYAHTHHTYIHMYVRTHTRIYTSVCGVKSTHTGRMFVPAHTKALYSTQLYAFLSALLPLHIACSLTLCVTPPIWLPAV